MSGGPIKRERDAWKPPKVSTGAATSTVHLFGSVHRAYCGRSAAVGALSMWPDKVTCSDCLAALAADQGTGGGQ